MAKHLLVLEASAAGPNSSTRRIANVFLDAWSVAEPGATVTRRDVVADPIPHVGADYIANMRSTPGSTASRGRKDSARLTQILQSEVLSASHIMIATPMHIFSVPSSLKAWCDHIFHNGVTFRGSAEGLEGLLGGRKVFLITSRGGDYRPPSPLAEFDMLTPYFQRLFAFCGATDFTALDVHNGMFDPDDHAALVGAALADVRAQVAAWAR